MLNNASLFECEVMTVAEQLIFRVPSNVLSNLLFNVFQVSSVSNAVIFLTIPKCLKVLTILDAHTCNSSEISKGINIHDNAEVFENVGILTS